MERSRIGCTHSQANCRRVKPQHPHCLTPPQRANEVWRREAAGPQIRRISKERLKSVLPDRPPRRSGGTEPFRLLCSRERKTQNHSHVSQRNDTLGRRLLDERAWLSRTNPHYVIIRPWLKARQKR